MQGASHYYDIITGAHRRNLGGLERINEGEYRKGSVMFRCANHARGKTFRITLNDGAHTFEVYGVVGGQPGWTEEYDWTQRGAWVPKIEKYLADLEAAIAAHDAETEAKRLQAEREKQAAINRTAAHFHRLFTDTELTL